MARFKYLNKEDVAPEHREHMRDINLTRPLFHNPEMARAHSHTAMYIRFQSKLDPRLREMAILQVGYCARSPYEWSHHVKIGHDFGVSDDDIRALIDDSAGKPTSLDDLSRTVLRAAREMTTDGAMADGTFATLQAALGNEQVVDLTITIAFYNAVVRVLATLQIDVEPEYMPYLQQLPLPS